MVVANANITFVRSFVRYAIGLVHTVSGQSYYCRTRSLKSFVLFYDFLRMSFSQYLEYDYQQKDFYPTIHLNLRLFWTLSLFDLLKMKRSNLNIQIEKSRSPEKITMD